MQRNPTVSHWVNCYRLLNDLLCMHIPNRDHDEYTVSEVLVEDRRGQAECVWGEQNQSVSMPFKLMWLMSHRGQHKSAGSWTVVELSPNCCLSLSQSWLVRRMWKKKNIHVEINLDRLISWAMLIQPKRNCTKANMLLCVFSQFFCLSPGLNAFVKAWLTCCLDYTICSRVYVR